MENRKRVKRLLFTPEEDAMIIQKVNEIGLQRAVQTLEKQLNRPKRIIKEHYVNTLDPSLDPTFSEEDDIKLLRLVKTYGTQWEIIAHGIQSKSPSHVKGRYNILLSKINKGEVTPEGQRTKKFKLRKARERRFRATHDAPVSRAVKEQITVVNPINLGLKLKTIWDKIYDKDLFE